MSSNVLNSEEIHCLRKKQCQNKLVVVDFLLWISENATIQKLLQITEHGIVSDISNYYPLSGLYFYTAECLPFLFIDGKVSYDVSFCDAKVVDFLNTHNITDNTLRITTDLPMAGGLGGPELLEAWNNIYPTLEQIAVLFTITGLSIKSLLFIYVSFLFKLFTDVGDFCCFMIKKDPKIHNDLSQIYFSFSCIIYHKSVLFK